MNPTNLFAFTTLPLKQRFTVSTGLMLLPLLLLTLGGYLITRATLHFIEKAQEEALGEMLTTAQQQGLLLKSAMPVSGYLIHGGSTDKQLWLSLANRVEQGFNALDGIHFGEEKERKLLATAKGEWQRARLLADRVMAAEQPMSNVAMPMMREEFDKHIGLSYSALEDILALARQELVEQVEQTYLLKDKLLLLSVTLMVTAVILILLVGTALSRSIMGPLNHLLEGAVRFGRGELDYRVPVLNNDGLTNLSTAINAMAQHLEESRCVLEEMSRRDGLTGLLDKREFERSLNRNIDRYRRYGQPFCLIMLDLDHFKKINDSHGHPVGDEVLKSVARVVTNETRDVDIAARYGGEELVVILSSTTLPSARVIAERIRASVSSLRVGGMAAKSLEITVSAGIASFPDHADNSEDLIAHADRALYEAKAAGRNQVKAYGGLANHPRE